MQPKVSIVVISYNSEKTIIETLESIKNQTYLNYEVIISDDCSTDKTIDIIKEWCKRNNKNDYKILKNNINEGVTRNINKGLKEINGAWIKLIAADDILVPTCLEDNINFISNNRKIKICFSKAKTFGKVQKIIPKKSKERFYNLSVKRQYEEMKWDNFVIAPTSFISTEIFKKYGFFDERIPMIEDRPYWLLLTSKGEKLFFLNKITVEYRVGESLSNHQSKIVHQQTYESRKLWYRYYIKNEASVLLKWHYELEFFIKDYIIKRFKNKSNILTRVLLRYFRILDIGYIFKKLGRE